LRGSATAELITSANPCLSISRISQKVIDGFEPNFVTDVRPERFVDIKYERKELRLNALEG